MTFIYADRVKETTTTTGTGPVTLAAAVAGFRAFSAAMANGDTCDYCIQAQTPGEWETGTGTWNTGGTLTRTTVRASSNANSAVSFSAGVKDVFITPTAYRVSAKADTASLATVATTGAYSDLSGKPTLGTASPLNVPASGDAASGEVVKGSDSRLTDARTPSSTLAHASTHASAGSDPVTLAESQVTNLVTDLGAKLVKASNLSDLASASTARTNLGLGTAATQASTAFAAASHTHPEADLSLSDVTTDNVSTARHGFAPKAPNDATKFLDGTGAYSTPSASVAAATAAALGTIKIVGTPTDAANPTVPVQEQFPAYGRLSLGGTNILTVPGVVSTASGNQSIATNDIWYSPLEVIGQPIVVASLFCEVVTAAAGSTTARMGIYNAGTDWLPTTLVVGTTTFAIDSTGVKSVTGLAQTLPPGRYVTAFHPGGNPVMRGVTGANARGFWMHPLIAGNFVVNPHVARGSYSALPGTAVAPTTFGTNAGQVHIVYLELTP